MRTKTALSRAKSKRWRRASGPRLLVGSAIFPEAAQARDGGFPPIMIHPIDFSEFARRNALGGEQPAAEARLGQ